MSGINIKQHYLYKALFIWIVFSQCSTSDPLITSTFLLEDKWLLTEVVAPAYPFPLDQDTNDISLSFPKTEEYELYLSEKSCSGEYIASQDGEIEFTRTNCSTDCCVSEWDHYFLTLLNKSTQFKATDGKSLKLIINEANYLIFDFQNKTLTN
nr:hypothetical protein [uncultured Carboxylicivirga sp.]